jgi:hypothetical protein
MEVIIHNIKTISFWLYNKINNFYTYRKLSNLLNNIYYYILYNNKYDFNIYINLLEYEYNIMNDNIFKKYLFVLIHNIYIYIDNIVINEPIIYNFKILENDYISNVFKN